MYMSKNVFSTFLLLVLLVFKVYVANIPIFYTSTFYYPHPNLKVGYPCDQKQQGKLEQSHSSVALMNLWSLVTSLLVHLDFSSYLSDPLSHALPPPHFWFVKFSFSWFLEGCMRGNSLRFLSNYQSEGMVSSLGKSSWIPRTSFSHRRDTKTLKCPI